MLPEVLDLGFVTIRGYGLMIGLGLLLSYNLVLWEARRSGFTLLSEKMGTLLVATVIASFLGGKLAFALAHPEAFDRIRRDEGLGGVLGQGFVFYGSLLAAVPTVLLLLRYYRLPVIRTLDLLILGLPVVHGMGRIGCFLAGCCYGCRTDLPWAVTFTRGQGLNGLPLHPVQLYEAAGEAMILLVLWFGPRRRPLFAGLTTLTYLLLYGVLRLVTESFRGDGNPQIFGGGGAPSPGDPPAGLTLSQGISLILILVAVLLLSVGMLRHRRQAADTARE